MASWLPALSPFSHESTGKSEVPTRDRAYVVGEHGMKSIVIMWCPSITAKGTLEAPMMPKTSASQGSPN